MREITECLDRLEANGVQVIRVDQGPYSPERFGATIKEVVDDFHGRQLSEQTQRGRRHRTSQPSYGYEEPEAHDGDDGDAKLKQNP